MDRAWNKPVGDYTNQIGNGNEKKMPFIWMGEVRNKSIVGSQHIKRGHQANLIKKKSKQKLETEEKPDTVGINTGG